MKTIAIIGASYLQQPIVERAKQMGLRTICFSWPQGAVCKELCDVFYPVSITEKEEILRICQAEHIDGICTIGSDVAAPTVAYVAEQMGLPGNTYEAAVRAHDKHQMREALVAAGVDCPKYIVESQKSKVESTGLELPLIVKPSDRSGSLGVKKIEQWEDLEAAVQEAEKLSIAGEALVEEYIDGREISVETISQHGQHFDLQITDKVTTGAPHFVELAHHQPSSLPEEVQARIFTITHRALDALGLTDGAAHSEYKITASDRIVVMEIGGRMGGDFIGSHLVRLSTGYDFLQGVIEVALGQPIHPEPKPIGRSSVFFTAPENVSCSGERTGYRIYQNDKLVES
ncbi:MAG: ATP-grasp domain-containing protein [Paludibacteraceae bacterium]|nr:ATP-grasp domain-containing protein [Paludibacteraceae bacterium]